ncbi:MAG: hypothetical protein ACJ0P3_01185, partial [Flavobacteriaceae bacterium]
MSNRRVLSKNNVFFFVGLAKIITLYYPINNQLVKMEITLKGDAQIKSIPSLKDKALRINLNENIYGTFAEIGAGQETVRHFFRAGGASGTIAKAMSAYD